MKKHLNKIKYLVSLSLLVWIFSQMELSTLWGVLRNAKWSLVLAVLCIEVLSLFLQGWRLHILLESDGKKRSLRRVLGVNFLATFFDTFVPGRLGSDTWRAIKLREQDNTLHLVITLLAMRLQGVFTLVLVFCLFAMQYTPEARISIALAVSGLLFCFFAAKYIMDFACRISGRVAGSHARFHKADAFVRSLRDAILTALSDPKRMLSSTVVNILFALGSCLSFALAGAALGIPLPLHAYFLGVPALMIMSVVPITIQGRGSTELIALYMWKDYGVGNEQIVLLCLIPYAATLCYSLFAGALLGVAPLLKRKA